MSHAEPKHPPTTSVTLLGRLRDPTDASAWREFDSRYREMIVGFLRRRGLQVADAEDCAQATILGLVRGLRGFEYDAQRAGFRAYLFRCVRSVLADWFSRHRRGSGPVAANGRELPSEQHLFESFEREWIDHHYRLATRRYRERSDPRAIAILEATLEGKSARLLAEALGMTKPALLKAQQRLRDCLRELIAEQLRDEDLRHGPQ
ncbi:MAG: RNA polymerase sigma factor [Phycisphaerales bacterium]